MGFIDVQGMPDGSDGLALYWEFAMNSAVNNFDHVLPSGPVMECNLGFRCIDLPQFVAVVNLAIDVAHQYLWISSSK
jgi:hypothetical protein